MRQVTTMVGCCLPVCITVAWLTGMHLWRCEYSPFIRDAQMEFCRRIIVVPLTTFHRLAEAIGDPRAEIIFLFNTSRCGSTLFTQVKHQISVKFGSVRNE